MKKQYQGFLIKEALIVKLKEGREHRPLAHYDKYLGVIKAKNREEARIKFIERAGGSDE